MQFTNFAFTIYDYYNCFSGYDKAVRPVRNKSDVIDIEIDITYDQVI